MFLFILFYVCVFSMSIALNRKMSLYFYSKCTKAHTVSLLTICNKHKLGEIKMFGGKNEQASFWYSIHKILEAAFILKKTWHRVR